MSLTRELEDLYYSSQYEAVITRVRPIWFAEVNTDEPSLLAWQALAFEVRCCYQLEKLLEVEDSQSSLIKFGSAYLDYLNQTNLLKSQQILSELSQKFSNILPLRAITLRFKIESNKLQAQVFLPESQQLVKEFNNDANALEVLMHNYQIAEQTWQAFNTGKLYLTALQKNEHSPLRYFEEKVRISAFLISVEHFVETEKALADLLFQKTQMTKRGRARAYFYLGHISQRSASNTESKKAAFRQYSQEVANRFFHLAFTENKQERDKVAKILNQTIQRLLHGEFDYSTSIPRYKETKPDLTEQSSSKWIDYGSAMAREGNASEARIAYLKASYLSIEQGNSQEAIKAIHYLLPEHLSSLTANEITILFRAWEDKFGTLDQPQKKLDKELRRIRLLTLRYIVEGQYQCGARLLGNLLFSHQFLNNVPKDELRDAFYRLGNFSYWAGLYELSAKAWDVCYEMLSEASLKEQIKNLLQLDKVCSFSKYVECKESSEPITLHESFIQLELILNKFAISQDARAIWLLANDISKKLSNTETYQLKNISATHYQIFEQAYQLIKEYMGASEEFTPFASGVARNAAKVEFVGAYPEWGKLWREIIYDLQERAKSGSFNDTVLSFDTEREISKLIGDWQHETRSAARAVLAFLKQRENPDIAGYCIEIMHSLHRGDRLLDAAIMANLGIESLKFTRRRMETEVSREAFFIERFFIYHQALEFIETCLSIPELTLEVKYFFASIYWSLSEGFKARYFFDTPLIKDTELKPKIQQAYEQDEKLFFEFASALMEQYGANTDNLPDFDSVLKAVQPLLQNQSCLLNKIDAELPLQYQLQIKSLSIFEAQQLLDNETALLVIVAHPRLQDEYGGLLLIRKEQVDFVSLSVFRYEQDILQPMYASWQRNQNQNNTLSGLGFLYRTLIEPFEQALQAIQHLIISPSGTFNNVPFAALWNEQNQQYLVEKLGITVIPSGQLLPLFSRNQVVFNQGQALLALHPIGTSGKQLPKSEAFIKLPGKVKSELSDLKAFQPYAEQEYIALRKHWQGELKVMASKSLNLESAEPLTKTKLLKFMSSASLIHLSMHGIFSQVDTFNTSVILVPSANEDYDLIFPKDIAALDLTKNYLIIVNACQVGQSYAPHTKGEDRWLSRLGEFTGFPRAFFEAGTRSIIAALDNIPAVATGVFAEKFYEMLNYNVPIWKALAQTQREFIKGENSFKDFQHPRFWGLYLLLGSWN
ncbi:MAG: CHAT domain-containing protein [Calothrix sp. C42_A2020_038]|nr:CHAT domain-containing protein [Calothrix sp. C42_A2020_038]